MILTVRNLSKSYSNRRVVDRVSFDVAPGSVIGLLGKNGAGKTTTFRMTTGMVQPDQGQVFFNGEEISNLPMYQRARRGMGYLPQETSVFRGLTVRQNLISILETRPLSEPERNVRLGELIEEFGLEKVADSRAEFLSGGEKRRLEVRVEGGANRVEVFFENRAARVEGASHARTLTPLAREQHGHAGRSYLSGVKSGVRASVLQGPERADGVVTGGDIERGSCLKVRSRQGGRVEEVVPIRVGGGLHPRSPAASLLGEGLLVSRGEDQRE